MTQMSHGLMRYDLLVEANISDDPNKKTKSFPATFGRLRPKNPVQLKVLTDAQLIGILEDLALKMGKQTDKSGTAPAGMTFFGQFVDHDITLDATSALGTRIAPSTIPNVRSPGLDLDCVYGHGPEVSNFLYGSGDSANFLVYGNAKNAFDLARTMSGAALIGDFRNDENAVVSQIQANFIALHNLLMTQCLKGGFVADEIHHCSHLGTHANDWEDNVAKRNMVFEEVRRFIRLHYQYVVWNEFLPTFVDQSCLDEAAGKDLFGADAAIMPVEFTGAAYRFGHATAQPDYRLQNGKGQVGMDKILGFGQRVHAVDMAQMFDIDGKPAQRARPVGTTLGLPLTELHFIHDKVVLKDLNNHELTLPQSQNLPLRNMIRDRYTYQLESGEGMRDHLRNDLDLQAHDVTIDPILSKKGITKTPLWYYCLQEAEQHGGGKLTGVGGAIVASVFARLLRCDPTTVWHAHGFKPSKHFANDGGVLAGIMKFVETNRDGGIANADDLKNG